jgi:signal transduction histidine kinase
MPRATEIRKPFDAIGRQMGAAKKIKSARRNALDRRRVQPIRRRRAHVVQFYSEDSHLLDSLAGLVQQSLSEGNSAIVIATAPHRAGLRERLEVSGLPVDRFVEEYRLIVLDAEASLASILANGVPDMRRFKEAFRLVLQLAAAAAVSRTRSVVAFGEMVALLWMRGRYEAAIRLEQLWNAFQEDESFFLYCAYPLAGFDGTQNVERFQRVCNEHSQVVPAECLIMDLRDKIRVSNTAPLTSTANVAAKRAPLRPQGRAFPALLLQAQDEERRRIARNLHDSTGQKLALLSMNLSLMDNDTADSGSSFAKTIAESREILRDVCSELRTLSYELHPPLLEELGLVAALKWFVDRFKQRSGITVSVNVADNVGRLSADVEITFFRVIQEALTNAHRHSGTATAEVCLERSGDGVVLSVSDAGKGIGPDELAKIESAGATGIGIGGMRERVVNLGGRWEVLSSNHGTEIRVTVPGAAQVPAASLSGREAS